MEHFVHDVGFVQVVVDVAMERKQAIYRAFQETNDMSS